MSDIEEKAGIIKQVTEVFPEPTQEANKALTTIGKTINLALAPLSGLIWGYDKISSWIEQKLADRLKDVPEDNIITPPVNIAGPTIEAMRFTSDDELREMYANLLAASMNKETVYQTHPRFVDIIKHLSIDEAHILNYCAQLYDVELVLEKVVIVPNDHSESKMKDFYSAFIINRELINPILNLKEKRSTIALNNLVHLGILEKLDALNTKKITLLESQEIYPFMKAWGSVFEDESIVLIDGYIFTSIGSTFLLDIVNPK